MWSRKVLIYNSNHGSTTLYLWQHHVAASRQRPAVLARSRDRANRRLSRFTTNTAAYVDGPGPDFRATRQGDRYRRADRGRALRLGTIRQLAAKRRVGEHKYADYRAVRSVDHPHGPRAASDVERHGDP